LVAQKLLLQNIADNNTAYLLSLQLIGGTFFLSELGVGDFQSTLQVHPFLRLPVLGVGTHKISTLVPMVVVGISDIVVNQHQLEQIQVKHFVH
jgi:hypothetical protein